MPTDASRAQEQSGSTRRGAVGKPKRVLPLLADAGNRRVLVDWLDGRFDVLSAEAITDESAADPDLCIADVEGYREHRDALVSHKDAVFPRIVPYLLVVGEDGTAVPPDLEPHVDDVLPAPVSQRELGRRIDALLRLRSLSLELERRNAELDERNEQLEHLIAAAAHDLRNPLNVAAGSLDRLEDGVAVERIERAIERMSQLVESVLAVSRTHPGAGLADVRWLPLEELVHESWRNVQTDGVELRASGLGGASIQASASLLRQLFENLFRNAVEHGGEDISAVRVGLLEAADGFYVADDGAGIPPEDWESVFERGASSGTGFGLGLEIVKRVAEAHGWTVRVSEGRRGGARIEVAGASLRR